MSDRKKNKPPYIGPKHPLETMRHEFPEDALHLIEDLLRTKKQFTAIWDDHDYVITYSTGPTYQ